MICRKRGFDDAEVSQRLRVAIGFADSVTRGLGAGEFEQVAESLA
jgi:hypothetical protein